MGGEEIYLRTAVPGDAEELLAIYTPYIEKTAITFEYDVPSAEEFRSRIEHTLRRYPYIVICSPEEILGYAYTGAFKGRQAYDWSVETSVYLRTDRHRMGLGGRIYEALEEISAAQNITNLYACIGYPSNEDDEYLTRNSAQFHEHLGYSLCGRFHDCGYKFGRWYDMIWMEKILGQHSGNMPPFIPFPELEGKTLKSCGLRL